MKNLIKYLGNIFIFFALSKGSILALKNEQTPPLVSLPTAIPPSKTPIYFLRKRTDLDGTLSFLGGKCNNGQSLEATYPKPFQDQKTQKFGYRDAKGEVVIPAQFHNAHPFISNSCNGAASIALVQDKQDERSDAQNDRVMLSWHNNFFIINTKGKKIARAYFFDNGPDYVVNGLSRICALNESKVGFMNWAGDIVVPPIYTDAMPFHYNFPITFAYKGGRAYHTNTHEGCRHDQEFKEGHWGMVDKKGREVIPFIFDDIGYDKEKDIPLLIKDGKKFAISIDRKTGKVSYVSPNVSSIKK